MNSPEQSHEIQKTDNSAIRRRVLRNVLVALMLCLSYLLGKFIQSENNSVAHGKGGINYTILK